MIINETLARGLKDRFFRDFSTDISAAYHKELRSMTLKSIKRGKWVKATRVCLDRLDRFSIASYEGGSKVKPYFVTNVLEVESARQYNTWNEKCLYSFQLLFAFDPPQVDCRFGHFNIGEHAIFRLFMRAPVQEDAHGSVLPYSIIKQLRYVPFWSAFWVLFQLMVKDIDFRDDLSIIIPAPDGLFMAQPSKNEPGVEIRTFIDYEHTNDDRKMVRDLMIRVSEPLLESPLSASPAVEAAHVDSGNVLLMLVVCKKLAPHSDALARCLFPRKEQQPTPPNAHGLFQEQLSRFAATANSFWDAFENLPLRQFLTQGNHWMRRGHATKSASGAP